MTERIGRLETDVGPPAEQGTAEEAHAGVPGNDDNAAMRQLVADGPEMPIRSATP